MLATRRTLDARAYWRHDVRLPAHVKVLGQARRACWVRNISVDGALIEFDAEVSLPEASGSTSTTIYLKRTARYAIMTVAASACSSRPTAKVHRRGIRDSRAALYRRPTARLNVQSCHSRTS